MLLALIHKPRVLIVFLLRGASQLSLAITLLHTNAFRAHFVWLCLPF
jgi:hypothetical protein